VSDTILGYNRLPSYAPNKGYIYTDSLLQMWNDVNVNTPFADGWFTVYYKGIGVYSTNSTYVTGRVWSVVKAQSERMTLYSIRSVRTVAAKNIINSV